MDDAGPPSLSSCRPSPGGNFLEHFNFEKVGCPRRIEPVSLCPLRLLPGAGGGSPARRGAGGERGPPLHPRTPLCAGTRNLSLEPDCTPSAACRIGHRREPSRPFRPGDVRACFGAPSALGRPGSPSRPRHATSEARAEEVTLSGGSEGGKLADGRAAVFPLTFGRAALPGGAAFLSPLVQQQSRETTDFWDSLHCRTSQKARHTGGLLLLHALLILYWSSEGRLFVLPGDG